MHFQSQNFCVSMFASSWFLTLFATALPLPVACRIFDVLLSEVSNSAGETAEKPVFENKTLSELIYQFSCL